MGKINGSIRTDTVNRLFAHIEIVGDCWIWSAAIQNNGYSKTTHYVEGIRKHTTGHRAMYMALVGAIPAGLTLDHLCRNILCINPSHLEPTTILENLLRSPTSLISINKTKVECLRGHSFTAENTYIKPNGARECKTCIRIRTEKYLSKRRVSISPTT